MMHRNKQLRLTFSKMHQSKLHKFKFQLHTKVLTLVICCKLHNMRNLEMLIAVSIVHALAHLGNGYTTSAVVDPHPLQITFFSQFPPPSCCWFACSNYVRSTIAREECTFHNVKQKRTAAVIIIITHLNWKIQRRKKQNSLRHDALSPFFVQHTIDWTFWIASFIVLTPCVAGSTLPSVGLFQLEEISEEDIRPRRRGGLWLCCKSDFFHQWKRQRISNWILTIALRFEINFWP